MQPFMGLWSTPMAVIMIDEAVAWKMFRSLGPEVCGKGSKEKPFEHGYAKFLVGQ